MNTIRYLSTTLKETAQVTIANMTPLLNTYKAVVFEKANAQFTLKNLPLKAPSAGEGLVKVLATEVCHPDAGVQAGAFRNSFPITHGHQIIGNVAAVGDGENK